MIGLRGNGAMDKALASCTDGLGSNPAAGKAVANSNSESSFSLSRLRWEEVTRQDKISVLLRFQNVRRKIKCKSKTCANSVRMGVLKIRKTKKKSQSKPCFAICAKRVRIWKRSFKNQMIESPTKH